MKILKTLYTATLCAAMAVSTSSCLNSWLDQSPADGIDAETAIKNSDDLANVRTGLYAAVKGNSSLINYYGRLMFVYGDMRGEDIQYEYNGGSGRANFYYYMEYTTADNFTTSTAVWQMPYVVIARANRLIQAAESGNLTDAAEAKATIDQYDAEAEVGYVNLWAAKALQVRVYMTKGEWSKALFVAEDIISNSSYKLWEPSEYVAAWSKSDANHSKEIMFEISINNNTDWTDREGIAYLYADKAGASPGYGDVIVTKDFSDMLTSDPADIRNDILLAAAAGGFDKRKVYINKMPAVNGDVRYSNVPLLRLSEVYLSAAEAAFQAGDKNKAANLLNDIISNRTTDESKQVTSGNITLDRIYIERRKELVGEGQRYFDVMRRGETVTRYTDVNARGWHDVLSEEARTFNRDSKKALPLIPVGEINANPNIEQNPGY